MQMLNSRRPAPSKRGRRRAQAVALFWAVMALAPSALAADGTLIQTGSGPVQGTLNGDVRTFLGIPYAAPPVGDLRWRAPEAPADWSEPLDASAFGSSCPQVASPFGIASENEDCLFLNVYAPKQGFANLRRYPVMVWFHPGAFTYGDGGHIDPTDFVEQDVVVVTVNYRLGPFGFLAHPALSAESPDGSSGNYGLLDQQAALRWVRDNIAQFSGDRNRVTIFGESAGGFSVHAHMVSPAAAGLFDRAIVQSGAYSLTPPALADVQLHGAAFAAAVGCANQDPACLRALPPAAVLAGPSQSALGYIPNVDGAVLPATFLDAFASGNFNKVPVIEGTTHDEWRLFVALSYDLTGNVLQPADYPAAVAATLGLPAEVVPLILQQYPLANYASPAEALAAVGTDAVFACNAQGARQLLSLHVPVWGYEFDDPDAPNGTLPPVSFPYDAYHGSEIQFLFETRELIPRPPLTADQVSLSQNMQRYWTAFARLGNPNTLVTPPWVRYVPVLLDQVQLLTPPAAQGGYTAFNADHKCDFWTALAESGS